MRQLYASLQSGRVTASVALKRPVACSVKNRFYRAKTSPCPLLPTISFLVLAGAMRAVFAVLSDKRYALA
jgi:hypothetical protein